MTTVDIAAFIKARLGEDEAAAKAVTDDDWGADPDSWAHAEWQDIPDRAFTHARRHDPARALREVAAGRAIATLHRSTWNDYRDSDGIERTSHECRECEPSGSPDNWPCPTIRQLAAIWSDHPDYRQEWTP